MYIRLNNTLAALWTPLPSKEPERRRRCRPRPLSNRRIGGTPARE